LSGFSPGQTAVLAALVIVLAGIVVIYLTTRGGDK
jgi:hypothetical protein